MQIVIIVTIVFFVLTLAGTWLARRSAYSWADNERSMGEDADASRPESRVDPSVPGRSPDHRTPGTRQPTRSTQIVVTGFDTPTKD